MAEGAFHALQHQQQKIRVDRMRVFVGCVNIPKSITLSGDVQQLEGEGGEVGGGEQIVGPLT